MLQDYIQNKKQNHYNDLISMAPLYIKIKGYIASAIMLSGSASLNKFKGKGINEFI